MGIVFSSFLSLPPLIELGSLPLDLGGSPVIFGYARVSTHDQDTSAQVEALRVMGCGRIFEEKASISGIGSTPATSASRARSSAMHARMPAFQSLTICTGMPSCRAVAESLPVFALARSIRVFTCIAYSLSCKVAVTHFRVTRL